MNLGENKCCIIKLNVSTKLKQPAYKKKKKQ